MMGAPEDEQDWDRSQGPQHQVTVPRFWISQHPVTKGQWTAVMGTTPWAGQSPITVLDDPDSPAIYVSWEDARAFVMELSALTGDDFRLPTEAEWEYACRARTTTRFYWGDDPNYTVGDAYCWWKYNTVDANEPYAHVVGQKLPNDWGLYDMSGNVNEWCEDDYHGTYTGAPTDGSAWVDSPRAYYRVVRGGCYKSLGAVCRSAFRGYSHPDLKANNHGFRIAR